MYLIIMVKRVTDRGAVEAAMDEFDRIGRAAFLEKYGFGAALRYFIENSGRQYDSKAIYGAAHRIQFPDDEDLTSADFSGGEQPVRQPLKARGPQKPTLDYNPPSIALEHMMESFVTVFFAPTQNCCNFTRNKSCVRGRAKLFDIRPRLRPRESWSCHRSWSNAKVIGSTMRASLMALRAAKRKLVCGCASGAVGVGVRDVPRAWTKFA